MTATKILCPTDFSPGSRQAMRVAVRLANEVGAELVVAHAWHVPPMTFAAEYVFPPVMVQQICDDAAAGLDECVREAKDMGAKRVTSRLLSGVAWPAIVDALADRDIDLVVIGTHGRTGLARILLGSVAAKVVRHAPCSVLAVPPAAGEAKPFNHVLCPIDFSESAPYAIELAAQLAKPNGTGIMLFHAIEAPTVYTRAPLPVDWLRDLDTRATDRLETLAVEVRRKTPVPVATLVRMGDPGTAVLALLDEDRSYDLVITGSHSRTGVRRVVLGSVAEKIVRHAGCPVLVARHRTE